MSFKEAFAVTKTMQLAQEAAANNVTSGREDELVVYAKVNNFEGLKKARSKESHEQWQVNAPFGKIRVRKTSKDGLEASYSMAIKTRDNTAGIPGGSETEMDIDATVFEAFKVISEKGMIKDRYCFASSRTTLKDNSGKHNLQASELIYEVDMFPNGQGGYHEICKIDIELNDLLEKAKASNPELKEANITISISDLPFQPSNPILGNTENPEEKAMITKFYDSYFLAVRSNDTPAAPVVSEPPQPQENLDSPSNEIPDADATVVPEESKPSNVTEVLEPHPPVEMPPQPPEPEPAPAAEDQAPAQDPAQTPAEPTTDATATETPPESQTPAADAPVDAAAQPAPAVATTEVKIIQPTPPELFGKTFEGTQSGYKVRYEVDGKIHEIELDIGVKGKDIPVTVTYDATGNPKVDMKQ